MVGGAGGDDSPSGCFVERACGHRAWLGLGASSGLYYVDTGMQLEAAEAVATLWPGPSLGSLPACVATAH